MERYESFVERQIRQAQERGDFDDLPGSGRPLHGLDDPDPDWWVKHKMAREGLDISDALPPVMLLRKERQTYPSSLADVATEAAVREILADYNRRVLEDRRRPVLGRASPVIAPTVDVDEMLAQWRQLRAAAQPPATEDREPGPPSPRQSWWRRRARPTKG